MIDIKQRLNNAEKALLVAVVNKTQTEQEIQENLDELAFLAETAGAATIFLTIIFGIPVSTTHTITGAIVGVGATKRLSGVRWGVTVNLVWAWILTVPVSALVAAIIYYIIHFLS